VSPKGAGPATVDAAIVTHESAGEITACLESLQASKGVKWGRIAVVDNASKDETIAVISDRFPSTELRACKSNLGFAAATNLAASRGRAEFLLVVNPDVSLERDTVSTLAEVLRSRPEIGITGCRLLRPDGSEDHAARRSFPTPVSAVGHFTGLSRKRRAPESLKAYLAPGASEGGAVDAVNGALMLVRRDWFERIGGFDESYWMYMEDLDLCWRFRENGWLTWYEPSVGAVHVKGASSGRFRTLKLNWAFHRGMIRFYHDHLSSDHNPIYNSAVYTGVLIKFAGSALRSWLARSLGTLTGRNG